MVQSIFERYECKYMLTSRQYEAFMNEIGDRTTDDQHPQSFLSYEVMNMKKMICVCLSLILLSGYGTCTKASAEEATVTPIIFTENAVRASGNGIAVYGTTVTISDSGTYRLSGECGDGQIVIDAGKNDVVRLILDNISLSNTTTAPVYAAQAQELILVLADGSSNTFTDASVYQFPDGGDEPDAAVFVEDDLTITGNGSLRVTGNYRNGIAAKDMLVIESGDIHVSAVHDGLRGRDGLTVLNGKVTVQAGNDGMKANNDTDTEKGFVLLENGVFEIQAGRDGIQAETTLTIQGGTYTISTGGGSANAPVQQERFGGGWGRDRSRQEETVEETDSMKALKAGTELSIGGGSFTIDAEDDAVHANGNITVTGGSLIIRTGDDGFHADNALRIEDGDIHIVQSYEGLEGAFVDIIGGTLYVEASDDAINAAGGSDESDARGRDRFNTDSSRYVRIAGGTVEIFGATDGIDANGSVFLDGGTVSISSQSRGMSGAVDMDGSFVITGGKLITAGSVLTPAAESTQPSLLISYGDTCAAGSVISLKNADGATVLAYQSRIAFTASAMTSPDLRIGETYSLYINDEKRIDITLDGMITTISDSGGRYSIGGWENWGGGW